MRSSFIIHIDSLDILDDLDDQQVCELFRAIKSYQNGEEPKLTPMGKIAFSPFKNQFVRDDEKYTETCKKRAVAGSKGGNQKVANASNSKQVVDDVANLADSDSKNDSKSKSKSDSNNGSDKEHSKNLFDSFWENYPRKDAKKKSEVSFNRLTETKKQLAITDCKTRYLNTDKQYIPLATTYINGERWNDEIEKQPVDKHGGFDNKDYQAGATDASKLEWMKDEPS